MALRLPPPWMTVLTGLALILARDLARRNQSSGW